MAGLQTTLNSASVSVGNTLIPALPSFTNPALWAYLGGSLAASQNMPPGSTALTNVNAGPTYPAGASSIYGAGYATCTSNAVAGSQLGLSGPNDVLGSETAIVVFRTPALSSVQTLITSIGADNKGFRLTCQPSINTLAGTVTGAAAGPTLVVPAGFSNFAMVALVHTDGVAGTLIYDLTHALTGGTAGTTTPRTISSTPAIIVGAGPSGTGTVDIPFSASIPAALSLPTLQAIYASVKASLGLRGIVI